MGCTYKYKGRTVNEKELADIIIREQLSESKLNKSAEPFKVERIDNLSKLNEIFSGKYFMSTELSGMTMDQKVDNIYNKMVSMSENKFSDDGVEFKRNKVITIGGYFIDFNNVAKSQWKDLIRTELINKQDTTGDKVKATIIDFFNGVSKGLSITAERFNSYFDTNEQSFNYQDVERLTKVLNWDKSVKLMLLSDAISSGLIKDVDVSIIGDYNPIVSVRSQFSEDGKNYIKVDLIELSRRSLLRQEEGSQQDNIIGRIVGARQANRNGVTLSNSFMSRNNILLNLTANLIARNNNNIIIEDSLIVQVTPYGKTSEEKIVPTEVDHVMSKEQQRNMLKFREIANNLSDELRSHFMSDNEENNQHNYLRFLINFYNSGGGVGDNFDKQRVYLVKDLSAYFKKEGQSIYDKSTVIKRISSRLAYLHKSESALLNSPEAIAEHKYLMDALKSLTLLDNFSYQLNSLKDIDSISSQISIISAIPQEEMQKAQEIIITTSRKVVRDLKEFNKEFDSKVFDVYHKVYSKNIQAFTNENFSMYKNSYATIEDINGVRRNAGHLLWTTDSNLDKLFANQAAEKIKSGELTQEILNANKWVVNKITERYIDSLMHRRIISFGSLYDSVKGRVLTREDFKKMLFEETTYNPGMLPIMPKPTSEYVYSGDMGKGLKRQFDVVEKENEFAEILSVNNKSDNFLIDELGDVFLDQIAFRSTSSENMSFLGSRDFLTKIGLEVVTINGIDKIRTIDAESRKNNMFTNDLQKMMKTFELMGIRKQYYENDALPILNGMYFEMKLRAQLKGADNENIVKLISNYVGSAIKNEAKHLKGNPKIEKGINAISKLVTAKVMAANFSIAQVSAFMNFSNAMLEAISSDISGHYQFGAKELLQASALFVSDYGKVSELASRFQVVNASEMETISHFFTGYKGNKQLLSQFMMSFPNWATDFYARCTVMTAQMIKDGTWDAYIFDKEGGVSYNEKYNSDRWDGDEGEARREYTMQDHLTKGIGVNPDNSLKDAYTLQEMVNLKWLSDKYVIGAYDVTEKAIIGITVLSKQLSTFRTWMLAKAGVVYKKASFQNMGGRLVMIQDSDGRYIGKWERRQIEGFVNTWGRFVGGALRLSMKNPITWSTMNADEKQNIARGGMAVALFSLVTMLAAMLMDDDDDNPYDMIDSKTKEARYIPGIRFYKNFKYSVSSLILVEDIWGFMKNPFTSFNIINNFAYNFTGEFDVNRVKKGVQFWSGTDVATEVIRSWIVGLDEMSTNTEEELKKKYEERKLKKQEEKLNNQ